MLFCQPEDLVGHFGQLLAQYRQVFCSICLQKSRLRATAIKWRGLLQEALDLLEETSVQWAGWHCQAADFVVSTDFVQWLGGDAPVSQRSIATFQDAACLLPWLECCRSGIATCSRFRSLGVCFVPSTRHLPDFEGSWSSVHCHSQCFEQSALVDFCALFRELEPEALTYISCQGLEDLCEPPRAYQALSRAPLPASSPSALL